MPTPRLKINSFAAGLILSALCFASVSVGPLFAGEVTLEDDSLRVSFDDHSGALTRLENKTTHWVVERRPELGVSFRLFAPLPERRWNPIFGTNQVAVVEKVSSHEIHLQWKNLVSENGGVLPLTLTAEVTLTNGALAFNAALRNDSSLTVETVDYPYFGDLNTPARTASLVVRVATNNLIGNLKADEIYPHFGNEKGYWGVFWPLKMLEARPGSICLVSAVDEGLSVEKAVPGLSERMQYVFEQHPGVISTINNLVPPTDEISGTPVHLEFRVCHFIFAAPHSTMSLAPVTLRCYQGDWRSGFGHYKR